MSGCLCISADASHLSQTDAWLSGASLTCVCLYARVRVCVCVVIVLEDCQAKPKAAIPPCDRLQLIRRGPQ